MTQLGDRRIQLPKPLPSFTQRILDARALRIGAQLSPLRLEAPDPDVELPSCGELVRQPLLERLGTLRMPREVWSARRLSLHRCRSGLGRKHACEQADDDPPQLSSPPDSGTGSRLPRQPLVSRDFLSVLTRRHESSTKVLQIAQSRRHNRNPRGQTKRGRKHGCGAGIRTPTSWSRARRPAVRRPRNGWRILAIRPSSHRDRPARGGRRARGVSPPRCRSGRRLRRRARVPSQ